MHQPPARNRKGERGRKGEEEEMNTNKFNDQGRGGYESPHGTGAPGGSSLDSGGRSGQEKERAGERLGKYVPGAAVGE